MTQQQYIEYLIATPGNYTCTNLAAHLEGEQSQSHDAISDFLRREKVTPRRLWEVVAPLLQDSASSYLVVDDSVQDKRYSKKIELVKHQYSGAAGGLVDGIGIVNLLHSNGQAHSNGQDFYPIDFRLYAPDQDGKTKNDHFLEMLLRAKSDKQIKANTILFDSWYASVGNLKVIHRLGMVFVTTLKDNRLVSISKEAGYVHLDTLAWEPSVLQYGQLVKLKELPFLVRLFKFDCSSWSPQTATLTGSSPTESSREKRTPRLRSPCRTFKTRTPCAGRSSDCTVNSSSLWERRNVSAARRVRSATTWGCATWPGCR